MGCFGDSFLSVFHAGQTSWQHPQSVHETVFIVCLQARSATVPAAMRITGTLNLEATEPVCRLTLEGCFLAEAVILDATRASTIGSAAVPSPPSSPGSSRRVATLSLEPRDDLVGLGLSSPMTEALDLSSGPRRSSRTPNRAA
jgi:hypothetical protein